MNKLDRVVSFGAGVVVDAVCLFIEGNQDDYERLQSRASQGIIPYTTLAETATDMGNLDVLGVVLAADSHEYGSKPTLSPRQRAELLAKAFDKKSRTYPDLGPLFGETHRMEMASRFFQRLSRVL